MIRIKHLLPRRWLRYSIEEIFIKLVHPHGYDILRDMPMVLMKTRPDSDTTIEFETMFGEEFITLLKDGIKL